MRKVELVILTIFFIAYHSSAQITPKPSNDVFSLGNKKVVVYTTAKNTNLRISKTDTLEFKDFKQPLETDVCVFVDPANKFQTLVGIGGALTDASAETFAKLPQNKQKEFLQAYYDVSNGIGYTLARTSIHSSDFSSSSFTYTDDGDKELKTFSIEHDKKYRIPFIKQVMGAAGGKLTLFASPWSPPAWMKDNNSMLQGGKLLSQYMQSWANYFVKFINAYEKEGIPVWGLTAQNEPMAKQTWESCIFTAEEERDFIKYYLGPTLEKAGLGGKKLMAWDHNRDLIYQRASVILSDPEATKYIWGLGFHWYETWTGGDMQFENVKRVHESYPKQNLMLTEGCVERFDSTKLYEWSYGERYAHSMINDFNGGACGWTDWNVLLDERGGPNHLNNFCAAPVIADTRTGSLIFENSYYYIGHFSKFIRPGAKRIISSSNREILQTTAFQNADGKIVVVVMNSSDTKLPYRLWINGKAAETVSQAHSITTLVF
jgi:glucosylceramidase